MRFRPRLRAFFAVAFATIAGCCNRGPRQAPLFPASSRTIALPRRVTALSLSPHGGICAVATRDGRCELVRPADGLVLRSAKLPKASVAWAAAFVNGGRRVALAVGPANQTGSSGLALLNPANGRLAWYGRRATIYEVRPAVAAARDANLIAFYRYPNLTVLKTLPYRVLVRKRIGVHCRPNSLRLSRHGRYVSLGLRTIFYLGGATRPKLRRVHLSKPCAIYPTICSARAFAVCDGSPCYLGLSEPTVLWTFQLPSGAAAFFWPAPA